MDNVWIINRGTEDLEIVDMVDHKWIILKPGKPMPVRRDFALAHVGKYPDLRTCDNPETYFTDGRKMKHLVIRDAGIGDLLLLEPVLRKQSENQDIYVKTKFPEIYEGNPYIKQVFKLDEKIDTTLFDVWDDLRNYSETAPTRATKNRTDIYNEKFGLELDDKEPRIYYEKSEVSKVKRKEGHVYFVVQCDASHSYRRYDRGVELADFIVNADKKNHVILLGSSQFVKMEKDHNRIHNLQEQTTLREAIQVIKEADYFIGGDSGLLHVACSLHTPSIGIFSIITPDLRLRYYTGPYKAFTKDLKCIGCGDSHMERCNFGNKRNDPKFIAPCMDIEPKELYEACLTLDKAERRIFKSEATSVEMVQSGEVSKIGRPSKNKLTMPIIVQDEEKNLPRFIELVMSHPCIGRVIAIDGGSKDKTLELLTKAGAEVYTHLYDKSHPNMQAIQREYSTYLLKENENIIIMDADEYFSKELSDYLYYLTECKDGFIQLSRRTFDKYEDSLHPERQILNFPDWQPRVFCGWKHNYKWFRSPHHIMLNCPQPKNVDKAIIHCQGEGKNRVELEKQWTDMHNKCKVQYG